MQVGSSESNYLKGLTADQVQERISEGKVNIRNLNITKSIPEIFRDNLFTFFNLFNTIIAVLIFLVGEYANLLFMGVIILNVSIAIIQEIRSKKAVEKLSLISMPRANVIRDGEASEIAVDEVVLDDVVILQSGNQIFADCTVLEGGIEVNEALLTGESDPVYKKPGDELLSGSFVISGKCHAKVIHVGNENYAEKIAREASRYKKVYSELLNSLNKIVKFTGVFLIPVGILLFLQTVLFKSGTVNEAVVSSAAALIGMMPNGLVLLTSISLAVGVIKLARLKTMVQELYCIETLSRVDMLCLDKTGTLTVGKMTVCDVIEFENREVPFSTLNGLSAFAAALDDNNSTFNAIRDYFTSGAQYAVECTTPFSSERKWSSVTFGDYGTLILGAPEILAKGRDIKMPVEATNAAQAGSRVLLAAYSKEAVQGELPADIIPMAAIVICDAVKPDAKQTLDFFKEQGVNIKLISGDNPVTVSGIAQQVGLSGYDNFIDASTLTTEEEIFEAAKRYTIFGRVTPEQKKQLISALKQLGHTVAMTGDGVNDVLALREADCSIAMASGSDATRQVSQLVLMDSNFSSLPYVVMEGRRVINNITGTASLFLVKTVFSFLLSFITMLSSFQYPFIPVQLTLISSFSIGIPSFFIALQPNKERIKGAFIQRVLKRALPGGISVALFMIVIAVLQRIGVVSSLDADTMRVYIAGLVCLVSLFLVCLPLDAFRLTLFSVMAAGFYILAFVLRDILEIGIIKADILPVFITVAAAVIPVVLLLTYLIGRIPAINRALQDL